MEMILIWELMLGIVSGILGTGVIWLMSSSKRLLVIDNDRRKALEKPWVGSFSQTVKGELRSFDIYLNLKVERNKKIVGTAEYSMEGLNVINECTGGFYNDDYIHLNYMHSDKSIFQRGMMILRCSAVPVNLSGKFIGIGHITEEIVTGEIVLES